MKCVCGYEEPEYWEEQVPIYYKSGAKKGQQKGFELVQHHVKNEDKFIKVQIEKGFSFTRLTKSWYSEHEMDVSLYACPKCHTVKIDL